MKNNKRGFNISILVILFIFLLNIVSSAQIPIEKIGLGVVDELNKTNKIQVIIEIDSKNSINDITSSISETEVKFIREMMFGEGFVAEITEVGLNTLANSTHVNKISFDRVAQVSFQQSLPLINATTVWNNLNYTGKGQTVCVLDTGINWTHPALGGCFGTGCKVLGGYDFANNDNNSMDDDIHGGHGTNVAGIVAAKGTINGTAPDAKLIAMKD